MKVTMKKYAIKLLLGSILGSFLLLPACSGDQTGNNKGKHASSKGEETSQNAQGKGETHIFKPMDHLPLPEMSKYQRKEGLWQERYIAEQVTGQNGRLTISATQLFDIPTPVMLPDSGQGVVHPKPQQASFVVARATIDNAIDPLTRHQWGIFLQVPQPLAREQVALVRFDSGVTLALPWGECTQQMGCVATLKLTGHQLEELKNSMRVTVSFARFLGHDPVSIDLSLEGLDRVMEILEGWAVSSPLVNPPKAEPKTPGNYLLERKKPLF